MGAKGVRISDKTDGAIGFELPDILEEIKDGVSYHWSILDLYSSEYLQVKKEERTIINFEQEISNFEKGFFIAWNDLKILSHRFYQIYDLTLIAFKEKKSLRRFDNDQKMYEQCDISIVMFDSSYWEVFSKDEDLIKRLAKKFKETIFLDPDFKR